MKHKSEMWNQAEFMMNHMEHLVDFLRQRKDWSFKGVGEVNGVHQIEVCTPNWRGVFGDAFAALKCFAYEVEAVLRKEEEEERKVAERELSKVTAEARPD